MTNNELLSAMSDLLDQKLKAELQPVKDKLQNIDDRLQVVEVRLQNVDGRLQIVEERLQDVDNRLQIVEVRLQNVDGRLQIVEERLQDVDGRLQIVEERLQDVDGRLQVVEIKLHNVEENVLRLNLCHENDILPRLSTIESCYTSTYNRYSSYAEKMDAAFTDIDLLKIVVSDHSDKLQKLA